jgi:hypothetical protein
MISRRFALPLLLGCSLAACEASDPVAPALEAPTLTASSGPSLLICRSNRTRSTSGIVSPLGGTVALRGHSVQVPAGGLLTPTRIRITEPASRYMEISLRANRAEHFDFELPVLVTVSYARCRRSVTAGRELEVWHIDPRTNELLERMGGFDNPLTRSISFFTDHFSGYAIAESPRRGPN